MNRNARSLFPTMRSNSQGAAMNGKCLCGEVRWTAEGRPTSVHHCHCSMCRRWTGGAFATLVWFRRDSVRWMGAPPKLHRSSPIARRSHCETCGSPIHLAYDEGDDVAFAAGTVEHPELLQPTHHYGAESRLGWADIGRDLLAQGTQEQW